MGAIAKDTTKRSFPVELCRKLEMSQYLKILLSLQNIA
jgi:hypothetical protein